MLWRSRHPHPPHRHHALAPETSLRKAIAAAKAGFRLFPATISRRRSRAAYAAAKTFANRHAFLRRAAEAGAPAGKTIALTDDAMLEGALREFGLPLVLKCDHSWGGDGVAIARTAEEAHAAFRRFHQSRACAM